MIDFKLSQIKLFNFACYFGEQVIDFRTGSNNNIFLFKLPNGYGKTSLFHAIKWGFYGEHIEYFKDSDKVRVRDFLNDNLDHSKDIFFVEIAFEFGKEVYRLKRTYQESVRKSSILKLTKNGREISDEESAQEELDQIMPRNFADFFMFDGEQLSRFTTAQKEIHYQESIHQLLGLKQLRVLRDDLKILQGRYDRKLTQLNTTNSEVETLKKEIEGIIREIENCNVKISNYDDEIARNEEVREGLQDQLLKFKNLPKVFDELKKVTDRLRKLDPEINTLKNDLALHSENLFVLFIKKDMGDLIQQNSERINDLNEVCGLTDTQAETQSAKEEILRKSIPKCDVCGHLLNNEETKKLREEQQKLKESLKLFMVNRKERDELKKENDFLQGFLQLIGTFDFQKGLDDLDEKIQESEGSEKKKRELEKTGQMKEYGDLARIQQEISSLQEENTTKRNQIGVLRQKIKLYEKSKDEAIRGIKMLGHDDKMTQRTTALSSYISELQSKLDKALEIGTQSKRESIIKKSNELFLKITNKPDEYKGLEFENDTSYAFVIKTKEGKSVILPSKGEKQVLAMSFLLGLNQYTGRNNVILMDTPVATLDDVHSAGIGKALAELKNQVIFLAQPQELVGNIYSNIKSAIVKEFIVERENNKSIIKEVKNG